MGTGMDDGEHVEGDRPTFEAIRRLIRGMLSSALFKEKWSEEPYSANQVPQWNTATGKFKPGSTGGGLGHTIQDAGVTETDRSNLDFQDGFVVTDNVGADATEIDLEYA